VKQLLGALFLIRLLKIAFNLLLIMKIIIPSSFIAWHLHRAGNKVTATAIAVEFKKLAEYKGEVEVPVGSPDSFIKRVAKTLSGSGALKYRSYKGNSYPIAGNVAIALFEKANFELLEDGLDYSIYTYGAKTTIGENYKIEDI
jgi:hypothetical protein